MDNSEFLAAVLQIEKEKNISRDEIFNAISEALLTACKQTYGNNDNIFVDIDHETGAYHLYTKKTVVKKVEDPDTEISLKDAKDIDDSFEVDDTVNIELNNKEFGRIAANSAKNVMLQLLREEERKIIYDEFNGMQKKAATGLVQRFMGRGITINLGKADAILSEKEQIKNENLRQGDRIKVFILEVRDTKRGPKIFVSRTHPDLVRCLFEEEVTEVKDGVVEIVNIAREPGNRTKIAVYSNDPDVDPVGACVGMNGTRVNAIVDELHNEKIDIIEWDENPARLIENSLSPAKVISVIADSEDKTAKVVVPDYQLSLAIGKEGQNARLAAKLTGYKIDIKSETQAREAGELYDEYYDEDEYYEEDGYYEEGEAAQEEYAAEEAPAENTEE